MTATDTQNDWWCSISDGNWDAADSSFAKLPMVTKNDTAIYDLYAMFINLGRDTLSLLDMGSADSTRVWEVASDSTLDASIIAKGMLGVMLDTLFVINPEPFMLPSERRGIEEDEEDIAVESPTEAKYFIAYPNPFTDEITFSYRLDEECMDGCVLRILDIQGRVVFEQTLMTESEFGAVSVNLSAYDAGTYVCALYNNQRLLQTSRLIHLK